MNTATTESDRVTRSLQREPRGRREKAAFNRARECGTSLGVAFPNIHAPIDEQRTILSRHATPYAQTLAKWVGIETRVWVWGLSASAVADIALLIAAGLNRSTPPAQPLIVSWLGLTFVWLIAYLVGRARSRSAALRRGIRFSWLTDAITVSAGIVIIDRRVKAAEHQPGEHDGEPVLSGPAPQPLPYGVSDAGAPGLAAAWMRHLGEADAAPVSQGFAGSLHYVAAVLNDTEPVDAAATHRFAGQVLTDSRRPLIFAASSYTDEAVAFADQVNIPLFVYDAVNGNLAASNTVAGELIRTGL